MTSHVVVAGLMGVGKTTFAAALAERLGWKFSDCDVELEQLAGVDGAAVATRLGVPALHHLERGILVAALAREQPHVIAPAASVIDDEVVRLLLRDVAVVHVVADVELVHARQRSSKHRRAMTMEELRELEHRRSPWFRAVADVVVNSEQPLPQMLDLALPVLATQFRIEPTDP